MLECRSVNQTYNALPILADVSLAIAPGEIHQISGPSGGGKTTLLRVLCLLETPSAGAVLLDGVEYVAKNLFAREAWALNADFRRHVTLVSQQIFLWPHLTCQANIEAVGGRTEDYSALAERLNVAECLSRFPNQVSVGQRQRVALLRSIATRPRFLILDEVTSALDESMASIVTGLFEELARSGLGILLVTHRAHGWSVPPTAWWMEHGRLQCRS